MLNEKKAPRPWRRREEAKHEHPLKSLIHSFFKLGASLHLSQPIPHCHSTTPKHTHTQTHRTREQMNSHRHQWARSVDDTHWKQAESTERGWMTQMQLPAMLSTHPHYSLFSHVGLRGAPGTETLLFSPCFPTLGDWMAATQSSTFSPATYLELKTFISHRLPVKSSPPCLKLWSVVSFKSL